MENQVQSTAETTNTKFCKYCTSKIPEEAVICTNCGRQVEELKNNSSQPNIVINNDNSSVNTNVNKNTVSASMHCGRAKNKWVSLLLCIFLGFFGAHKFYEGKFGMGIIYLFTGGLFFIGLIIDFFVLLAKPNPYYI